MLGTVCVYCFCSGWYRAQPFRVLHQLLGVERHVTCVLTLLQCGSFFDSYGHQGGNWSYNKMHGEWPTGSHRLGCAVYCVHSESTLENVDLVFNFSKMLSAGIMYVVLLSMGYTRVVNASHRWQRSGTVIATIGSVMEQRVIRFVTYKHSRTASHPLLRNKSTLPALMGETPYPFFGETTIQWSVWLAAGVCFSCNFH